MSDSHELLCLQVPEVTPSGAPILPTLSVLRLGSNRLTSLSVGSFSACPALTELYLDKNNIDTLSNHTFSGLSKLEVSLLACVISGSASSTMTILIVVCWQQKMTGLKILQRLYVSKF